MRSSVSIFSSNKHQQHTLKPFEKNALQDLKKILNSSYKNKQVSMWGIPLTTKSVETTTTTQDKSDVILLKFLKAREFDVPESYLMLSSCLAWRKDFGADSIVEEELGFKELESGSGYMMNGFDRQGRPFLYFNNSIFKNKEICDKFLGDDRKVKSFVRWHVQVLERMIKMLDFNPNPEGINSITRVFDGKDYYSVRFRAPELKVVSKHIHEILYYNYPGMVSCLISINCPWPLFFYNRILISVLSRFVPQISINIPKFIQATEGNTTETLFKYIRPEYIPIQYGGLSRPGEFNYIPTKRAFELTVEGGETLNIPIEGIEAGAIITWDMVVRGWDLEYRVEFVPEAAESNAIVVERPKKMIATDLAVHNYFIPKEAGKLVLFIDNTTSRERKVVAYRYLVQQYQAKLA